jgi:hypothetical protein
LSVEALFHLKSGLDRIEESPAAPKITAMDGLSGAASVVAIIQIAQILGSALKDYYDSVRDARDDIRKLYNSVKSLEAILLAIHDVLNRQPQSTLLRSALFVDPAGPLRQSELDLTNLKSDLNAESKPTRFGNAARALTWPFKKKDVEKIVVRLERHKSSLDLEIGVETLLAYSSLMSQLCLLRRLVKRLI